MLNTGILNPAVLSLLARVRHTNTLVVADRGFSAWPMVETADLPLVDDVPTVLQVVRAIRSNFVIGQMFMAEKFLRIDPSAAQMDFASAPDGLPLAREPHGEFKRRMPGTTGPLGIPAVHGH